MRPLAWSPSGAHLLFERTEREGTPADVHVWSFAEKAARPFIATPDHEWMAVFSPDGGWVAYVASKGTVSETWVTRFPTKGDPQRIATDAVLSSWRADGREILVTSPSQDIISIPVTIGAAGVVAGPPTVLIRGPTDYGPRVLPTGDHSRFFVGVRPDPEAGVREIRLIAGLIDALREGRIK